MSNTRHIANKPLAWEVQPRPPRPAPEPPDPEPPVPPPPPPPPEGFRPEMTARIHLQQGITTIFHSGALIRTWCSLGIFNEDGSVNRGLLVASPNLSGINLWNNCSTHEGPEKLVVGGPDVNTTINPDGRGPYYIIPEGGSLVINHYAYSYFVAGYITVTGYTISLRDRNCGAMAERIIDSFNVPGFGSGLYGCRSGATHYYGRTFQGLEPPHTMVGYSYLPFDDCQAVRDGVYNEPTELQREQFQWLWMHPVDLLL